MTLFSYFFLASTWRATSWNDNTVVGLWKRAAAFSPAVAPFTKISYSKILSLGTADARDDYFKQQAEFISREGQKDEHAEFATNINGAMNENKVYFCRL